MHIGNQLVHQGLDLGSQRLDVLRSQAGEYGAAELEVFRAVVVESGRRVRTGRCTFQRGVQKPQWT
ncbi:hypothetical protein C731_3287 [Mycolicibacterium hassiacum DSM 44199]|uniref:Uncharacterized protein n=1 Tax=Mycolicibacterium hassiacum (strain DSM 44199 / CIP 105218 / JCM 12690 / 3849) TaxID=1122247 RepID=K5BDY2_MYCHD|nr:hypothetical protein C731_3287 [Mycolicibacterium hassiacum DSM 44199]